MFVEFPIGGSDHCFSGVSSQNKSSLIQDGLDLSEYLDFYQNDTIDDSSKAKASQREANSQHSKPIYDLFAVSNHFGQLQAGHYTAIVKNDDKWFQFNDHKISQIRDASQIVTSSAYILFYKRRGIDFNDLDFRDIQNKLIEPSLMQKQNNAQQFDYIQVEQSNQEQICSVKQTNRKSLLIENDISDSASDNKNRGLQMQDYENLQLD